MKNIFYFLTINILPIIYSCQSVQQYGEGQRLYERHCANCHADDGSGLEGLIPPLRQADLLQSAGAGAACWIRNGLSGSIRVNGREYQGEMPPLKNLSDIDITNILNFINNAWGNSRAFIRVDEVEQALQGCEK